MRELAADKLSLMVSMEEMVVPKRFMEAPYFARSVDTMLIAASMMPSAASGPLTEEPLMRLALLMILVRPKPPNVSVNWSEAVLSRPIWNWIADTPLASRSLPLNFAAFWIRAISDFSA